MVALNYIRVGKQVLKKNDYNIHHDLVMTSIFNVSEGSSAVAARFE